MVKYFIVYEACICYGQCFKSSTWLFVVKRNHMYLICTFNKSCFEAILGTFVVILSTLNIETLPIFEFFIFQFIRNVYLLLCEFSIELKMWWIIFHLTTIEIACFLLITLIFIFIRDFLGNAFCTVCLFLSMCMYAYVCMYISIYLLGANHKHFLIDLMDFVHFFNRYMHI